MVSKSVILQPKESLKYALTKRSFGTFKHVPRLCINLCDNTHNHIITNKDIFTTVTDHYNVTVKKVLTS